MKQSGQAMPYDLRHLNQPEHQRVLGPVQDDEALLLYALVRICRLRRILEVGAGDGDSARNFLAALGPAAGQGGAVYSVDWRPVPCLGPGHVPLCKDARDVTAADVGNLPLDLVFLDCHDHAAQTILLATLESAGLLPPETFLALHDTGLHRNKHVGEARLLPGLGWAHQPVERRMVNELHARGWDAVSFHCDRVPPGDPLAFRHGLTVLRRWRELEV
jgi:hypothetical protein